MFSIVFSICIIHVVLVIGIGVFGVVVVGFGGVEFGCGFWRLFLL